MEGSDLWRGAGAEGGFGGRVCCRGVGRGPSQGCHGAGSMATTRQPQENFPDPFSLMPAELSDAACDGLTRKHSMGEDHKFLLCASVSPSAPQGNCPPPSSPHPRNPQPG